MATTRHKGSAAVFEIALHGDTQVDISATLRGFDGITINEVQDDREIPGGGAQIGRQKLGYREGTSNFTVDENDDTRGVFWGHTGRRFDCSYYPEGKTSGKPQLTWEAILDITHNFEPRGVRRFTCAESHDGLVTYGTVA